MWARSIGRLGYCNAVMLRGACFATWWVLEAVNGQVDPVSHVASYGRLLRGPTLLPTVFLLSKLL